MPKKAPEIEPAFDRNLLFERCMNQPAIVQQVLTLFESASRSDLDRLQAAFDAGNLDEVSRCAHRIKGGSAQVTADRLASLAEEMEAAAVEGELARAAAVFEHCRAEVERCVGRIPDLFDKA